MLALGTRIGDEIHIDHGGERLTIVVKESKKHGKLRVLLDGPRSFRVLRGKLAAIERRQAAAREGDTCQG